MNDDPLVSLAAARAFERDGHLGAALANYLRARVFADVVRMIESHGERLVEVGHAALLARGLHELPPERAASGGDAPLVRAMLAGQAGHDDAARAWTIAGVQAAPSPDARAAFAYYAAVRELARGGYEATGYLEPVLKEAGLGLSWSALCTAALAEAYAHLDEPDRARTCLLRAEHLRGRGLEPLAEARVARHAAAVELACGGVREAQRRANDAVALGTAAGAYQIVLEAQRVLVDVAIDADGDHAGAVRLAEAMRATAQRTRSHVGCEYALARGYEALVLGGEDDRRLLALERDLAQRHLAYDSAIVIGSVLPARALRLACDGAFSEAARTLAPAARRQGRLGERAVRWAEVAVYAAAAGETAIAWAAVRAARAALRAHGATDARAFHAHAMLATALLALGCTNAARALLGRVRRTRVRCARYDVVFETIEALALRLCGGRNHAKLVELLAASTAAGQGGFARLFAALPFARCVDARMRRLSGRERAALLRVGATRGRMPAARTLASLERQFGCEPRDVAALVIRLDLTESASRP